MKTIFLNTLLIITFTFLTACSNSSDKKELQTQTVSLKQNTNTLYFNGIIEPLQVNSATTAFDGTIVKKNFDYGEFVKQNQLLLVINSSQFEDSFQEAVANYLKAQKEYADSQSKLQGTEQLKKLGIISQDEYNSTTSQVYNSKLSLAQAARKLEVILGKINTSPEYNETILHNTKALEAAMAEHSSNQLEIFAPSDGIVLLPTKSSSGGDSGDSADKPLNVGSQVKAGQAVFNIGDVSGLMLAVKVNEIHINDILPGQTATITSDAFPDVLQGKVVHVDQQAAADSAESTPMFIVKIAVPKITDAQRKIIHVGMSAKVELKITKPPTITLPISAVQTQQGKSTVKLLDRKTGAIRTVPVVTGATTIDSVIIQQGLKEGDEVILNDDH